ncbi:hypothetical protein N5S71_00120 [Aliarcobacter cryaerophilus]|uniref:carbamoyltransferase C-terminal domain-containing protein n=1 Tax=Aliarcobacter cryaerophilus TaxID=28198 RepID=UPI0021B55CAE|nr:carbamoyltransferase C-terminal domain-containing protein [Aliarcobacter cryaerophilus]MCT7460923.1 hypothetical protein [Aliarcobacter cryaerophilus]
MYILALHLGHNSTVSLYKDTKFLEVVSQEKFDNIKNSSKFPTEAIEYILKKYDLNPSDIEHIVNASKYVFPNQMYDYLHSSNEYNRVNFFRENIRKTYRYLEYKTNLSIFDIIQEKRMKKFANIGYIEFTTKLKNMGFNISNIHMFEHHDCHAYSPISIYGDNDEDWLIFTMDGSGDGLSSTVSTYKKGKIERIAQTHQKHSLGGVYSNTTKYLGMKILEHEYKVMGLAAYSKEEYFKKTYEKIYKDLIWLKEDGLTFDSKFPINNLELYLKEKAFGERFDNIAGSLQYFTEMLVKEWILNAIKKTGIKNIMTSGGVFMNVKMNQKILDMPEVEKAFFMPSCGDESNVFGATAYFVKNKLNQKMKRNLPIYLGMEYSNEEIEKFIKENQIENKYKVEFFPEIEKKIAQLLADFNTVARFAGRTEFGARSLGNRALLANPSDMKSFYMVNDQIKVRDFWMPFAPSILDTHIKKYVKNYDEEKYIPYYMIATYESTEEFQKDCRAAMHQGDKTARPQVVTKNANEKYYKVISEFEKLTGIGAVLNTSLNLHGYPLVGTPEQAIFTLENSDLQYLAIENWLISKK